VYSLGTSDFLNGDHCTLAIAAAAVSDTDAVDPPDHPAADYSATFDIAEAVPPPPAIKVSEIYGGGGNTGATLKNDFIELYNPTASSASLAGWSVQYASATGAPWQVTPLTGSIPAGRNYLVQEAAGTGGTVDLPSPDATGSISMAAAAGKVALVNSTVALSGTCPTGGAIVDFVGYGTTASCFEGTGPTSAPSNTTSVQRNGGGATDTDNNAADFTVAAPDPHAGADQAPTVASTFPVNGATDVDVSANLTVTFSEPVNVTDPWFDLTCNSLPKPATYSGGPTTFTIDPVADFVDGDVCSLTAIAANVADQDAVDPPDTMVMNFTVGFSAVDACVHTFTPIYDIQGSDAAAAITGNVTTAGVVVGDFEGGAAVSGFYLQDASGDGDPATSDGIFVYTGGGNANTVSAGEFVRVTGFARERFNQTTINGADDNNAAVPAGGIVHCGTGSVAPTEVTMPFASTTFPERYEGMLVNFPQPLVISEYFNYARFGEIVLAQPLAGEDRPFTGTSVDEPGAAANTRTAANAVRRITLDDNVSAQNPAVLRHPNGQPFSLTNRFRGGDTVANTTGILGFDFSLYRVHPTAPADYTAADPRPAAPENVGGTLRAAAMNTLNFFLTPDAIQDDSGADNPADNVCGGNANLECRGWDGDQPAEFDRQRDKLLQALAGLDADVIGLNELENTPGVEPLLDPTRGVVAGLNALPGVGPYDAIDTGVIGTDAIRVGIIYRSDVVRPVGAYKILDSTVDPRFIDTKNRPSVAQTFDVIATGARFTVVVNHLKSKGSDCNDVGDPDTGDGQGNCAGTREQAAKALVDWIATDPTGSGDRDYLILGDLNSYAMEDSVDAVKAGADDTAGTADDFTNLIAKYQGPFAHSYVFDGQSGYLDHALASATLIGQVTGAADWHINSDEPAILDYDTTFKPPAQEALYEPNQYRTSDHDPVVVGLNLLSYHFSGFEAPVDNPPTLNIAKAGQSVPVKFHLSGDLGLGVLFGMPFAMQHTCGGGGPSDAVDASNPGGSGLQFDPVTGTYTYVWKTEKNWTNQCRTFEITFDDGTYRRAEFSFTK
jgi:predicted extracellular nuclease